MFELVSNIILLLQVNLNDRLTAKKADQMSNVTEQAN